jgi:subtilisin family serine protease
MPCIAAVTPFGAQRPGNRGSALRVNGASDQAETLPSPMEGGRERIIVEFTAPARVRTAVSLRSNSRFAPPLERFREDLKRIRTLQPTSGDTPANAVEVRQEYTRAFSGVALSATPAQRSAIEKLPYVFRVHPDLPVTATSLEPGVTAIGADEVWRRLGSRGAGITVAVLDTGIDYRHPALGEGFGPALR